MKSGFLSSVLGFTNRNYFLKNPSAWNLFQVVSLRKAVLCETKLSAMVQ